MYLSRGGSTRRKKGILGGYFFLLCLLFSSHSFSLQTFFVLSWSTTRVLVLDGYLVPIHLHSVPYIQVRHFTIHHHLPLESATNNQTIAYTYNSKEKRRGKPIIPSSFFFFFYFCPCTTHHHHHSVKHGHNPRLRGGGSRLRTLMRE